MEMQYIPTIGLNTFKVCCDRVEKIAYDRLRWLKISLQILWKKVATATRFILAVAWQNVEEMLLEQLTTMPASHKTIGPQRSKGLNIAPNEDVFLVIIKARNGSLCQQHFA